MTVTRRAYSSLSESEKHMATAFLERRGFTVLPPSK